MDKKLAMRNLALEALSWHEALIQLLRHTVMFVITKAIVGGIVVAAADMARHVAHRRPHPNGQKTLTQLNMKHATQTARKSVFSCSTLAMSQRCHEISYYLHERQKVSHPSAESVEGAKGEALWAYLLRVSFACHELIM